MKINKVKKKHGKWKKTKLLIRHRQFKKYVPPTTIFNKTNLASFLDKYRSVYIKPDLGRHGHGVIQAKKVVNGSKEQYTFHLDLKRKSFHSFDELYKAVRKTTRGQFYLIQKGIDGIKYRNRPFDIRIMVQKSPRGKWEATGKIGRLAHPKKIVSNYNKGRNGGTPMRLYILLRPHLTRAEREMIYQRLSQLGIDIAKYFQRTSYKNIKAIGLDVILDRSKKHWIVEVNTAGPNPKLFRHLKQPHKYHKILRYQKYNKRHR